MLSSKRPICSDLDPFYYNGELVEDIGFYKPGGLHPVHLGDTFSFCPGSDQPRYKILQKLGNGHFSTVWLAKDMADHDRGVAIKICTADTHETAILQTLRLSATGNPHQGQKHVLQLLDHFQIRGPNGIHDALVTDVLIPSQSLRYLRVFDPKRASYQALLAVAYLTQCGVVHGDLHSDNIVFFLPGLTRLGAHVWMNILDGPELTAVIPQKFDGPSEYLPKYLVETTNITPVVDLVTKEHETDGIYAVHSGHQTIPEPRTPIYISAPEILIRSLQLREGFYKSEWRFQGDIWSLACSIYEMFGHGRLFVQCSANLLLEEMIHLAGFLPQTWLDLFEDKLIPHLENDEPSLRNAESNRRTLFTGPPGFPSAEEGFHTLLESMLKIDPTSRALPEQLIQSAWFADLCAET